MSAVAGFLFVEDFDLPADLPHVLVAEDTAAEPEIIVPSFSADELAQARADGIREGEAAGRTAAAREQAERDGAALATIAAALTAASGAAEAVARDVAERTTQVLLAGFAALVPNLCARHGEDEVSAILHAVLPGLRTEPRIVVRVDAGRQAAVRRRLIDLDPDLLARIDFAETVLPPGDVHVAWRNGEAVRDTALIWREIARILAPLGLAADLPADLPSGEDQ